MKVPTIRTSKCLIALLIVFMFVFIPAAPSFAQSLIYWDDGDPNDSNWSTADNWSTDTEPTILDEVRVNNGGTIDIDQDQPGEEANLLYLGHGVSTSGHINMTAGSLRTNSQQLIGWHGNGTFTQTGGDNNPASIIIARNSGATGTYNHSDGALTIDIGGNRTFSVGGSSGSVGTYNIFGTATLDTSGGETFVGSGGTGTVNQTSATTLVKAGRVSLGRGANAVATYNLEAGDFEPTSVFVGYARGAEAYFNQTGGNGTLTGTLYIGYESAVSGVYSEGTYTINENDGPAVLDVTAGTSSSQRIVVAQGNESRGTFNQEAGTVLAKDIRVGSGFNSIGNYNKSGGITQSQKLNIGRTGGSTGTFTQTGGETNISADVFLGVATHATHGHADGTYDLQDGDFYNNVIYVGNGGKGTFKQSGGYHETAIMHVANGAGSEGTVLHSAGTTKITSAGLYMGSGSNAIARYTLSGDGLLDATGRLEYIGMNGTAEFIQSGGENRASGVFVGQKSSGTYEHRDGILNVSNALRIGNTTNGDGVFTLSGANLTGSGDLEVRNVVDSSGTFQGYGTPTMTGYLRNNGKVIADGGILDMSNFSEVNNTIDNTTDNGWRSINGAMLVLPGTQVLVSDVTYNWGEESTDTDLDLINSASMTFRDVVSSGWVDISLKAPDRTDVLDLVGNAIVAGFWSFEKSGFTFDEVDLAFRYDDYLIASLGLDINDFQLINYDDFGVGTNILTSIDENSKTVYALNVTSVNHVSLEVTPVPEFPIGAMAPVMGLIGAGVWFIRRKSTKKK